MEVKGVEVKLVEMRGGVLLHPQATPLTEPVGAGKLQPKADLEFIFLYLDLSALNSSNGCRGQTQRVRSLEPAAPLPLTTCLTLPPSHEPLSRHPIPKAKRVGPLARLGPAPSSCSVRGRLEAASGASLHLFATQHSHHPPVNNSTITTLALRPHQSTTTTIHITAAKNNNSSDTSPKMASSSTPATPLL